MGSESVRVARSRDYLNQTVRLAGGGSEPLEGPVGNMIILDLAETGNYVAVRPSGTEPKVKLYMFSYTPAELLADLELARDEMEQRLDALQTDLKAFADKF